MPPTPCTAQTLPAVMPSAPLVDPASRPRLRRRHRPTRYPTSALSPMTPPSRPPARGARESLALPAQRALLRAVTPQPSERATYPCFCPMVADLQVLLVAPRSDAPKNWTLFWPSLSAGAPVKKKKREGGATDASTNLSRSRARHLHVVQDGHARRSRQNRQYRHGLRLRMPWRSVQAARALLSPG